MKENINKYLLLDIPFSVSRKEIVFDYLKDIITSSLPPKQIVTINLDNLRISTQDNAFKKVIDKADLILPDGFGVALLLNKKYKIPIERITGNDLLDEIIKFASLNNFKVAFVGSSLKTAVSFKRRLKKLYPGWNNYFYFSPSTNFTIGSEEDLILREKLLNFEPDILFAALGCPKQEIWIKETKDEIEAKINIGIGAAFDFYSGTKKRAPKIIQSLGFEWLWRLSTEPVRLFNRYIIKDFPFLIRQYLK